MSTANDLARRIARALHAEHAIVTGMGCDPLAAGPAEAFFLTPVREQGSPAWSIVVWGEAVAA